MKSRQITGLHIRKNLNNYFGDLAKQYQLPFISFFLEKVIVDLKLLQEDELHSTLEAQPIILASILPTVIKTLKK